MKKIKLTETELINLIKKSIKESEFSLEPYDSEYPRESGIKGIFGKYTPEVPNVVIRYMRKNPRLIFDRLFFEYDSAHLSILLPPFILTLSRLRSKLCFSLVKKTSLLKNEFYLKK